MRTTHGRPWKTVIVPVFTAAGIVFSANILSAQTETQVSPSVINLAAFGGTELTIHTQIPFRQVDRNAPVTATLAIVEQGYFIDELPVEYVADDGRGHMVIKIAWDYFRLNEGDPPTGIATFGFDGIYVDKTPFEGSDDTWIATTVN